MFYLIAVIIGLIFPLLTTIKRKVAASIFFWLGFLTLLFSTPWEDHSGWGDYTGVFVIIFTVPLYGLGIISWIIEAWMRKDKLSERRRVLLPIDEQMLQRNHKTKGSKLAWKIYFWTFAIVSLFSQLSIWEHGVDGRDVASLIGLIVGFVILFGYVHERITLSRVISLIYLLILFTSKLGLIFQFFLYFSTIMMFPILLWKAFISFIIALPFYYGIFRYVVPKREIKKDASS